jgi:hypothetical protein
MTAGMGYVGVKTGLFRAMAGKGPMRLEDVVRASGLQPRYVEEWLKGMSCAGYLHHDAATQTYALSEEHAFLLASDETDHFMGGLFAMAPVLLRVAPDVARAFELRTLLKPDATLFIIEPKAGDRLAENMNPVGTMFYGFSIFHCLTQSLASGGPGLGTCLGPARTEAFVREAGFRHVERLDIKSPVNLFYAARP